MSSSSAGSAAASHSVDAYSPSSNYRVDWSQRPKRRQPTSYLYYVCEDGTETIEIPCYGHHRAHSEYRVLAGTRHKRSIPSSSSSSSSSSAKKETCFSNENQMPVAKPVNQLLTELLAAADNCLKGGNLFNS